MAAKNGIASASRRSLGSSAPWLQRSPRNRSHRAARAVRESRSRMGA